MKCFIVNVSYGILANVTGEKFPVNEKGRVWFCPVIIDGDGIPGIDGGGCSMNP